MSWLEFEVPDETEQILLVIAEHDGISPDEAALKLLTIGLHMWHQSNNPGSEEVAPPEEAPGEAGQEKPQEPVAEET